LIQGAEQRGSYVEHQRRELARSAASALAPIGKAAYAFFYLRQMAAERAAGRQRTADDPARSASTSTRRAQRERSARPFGHAGSKA
jgi:hypothetical protein